MTLFLAAVGAITILVLSIIGLAMITISVGLFMEDL